MKKILALFFCLLTVCMLAFAVHAADHDRTVVYLKDGGTGDGSSPDSAYDTLTKCHDALDLSKDCTIVVCGPYTQSVSWVYREKTGFDGCVTFTSVYDGVDYRATAGAKYMAKAVRFSCFGEYRFENLDFEALGTNFLVVAQHNPFTIGEGVTVTGSQMKGGNIASSFAILGGWQKGFNDPPAADDRDTNITVLSGAKFYIVPFSRQIEGNYTGTANIKIGGNADVSVLHGSNAGPGGYTLGKVKVEITDNANVGVFYGATNAVTVESYDFTWTGGTIEDFQWNCKYTTSADLAVKGARVLNASPAVKTQATYATVAANFDTVNAIADKPVEVDPDALRGATVVYVKDGGTGNGVSADKALDNLADAFDALDLSKDCTVVICGAFTQKEVFDYGKEYGGTVTLTSVFGGKDYRKDGAVYQFADTRFICNGITKFENMDFVATGKYLLVVGQFYPVTVGTGVTITGDQLTGGSIARSFSIVGGYQKGAGKAATTSDRDTNITVLSGSKIYVVPFTREILGDYTGTANVKIGGNADISVLHGSSAYPDNISVGNVKVEIADDAHVGVFYGCTQVTTAGGYEFLWNGGSIDRFEWNCSATPAAKLTFRGAKVLRASDAAKAQANFADIAANFDTVAGVEEEIVNVRGDAPVNLTEYGSARGLFLLGLAQGYDTTGTNFGLTDKMTRVQTVVQVIRFLGVENEVKAGNFSHPFSDVPAWAKNYVGYAYANNITKGVSATKFGTDDVTTEAQYLTFMLRAIGYSDAQGDFTWSDPYAFSNKVGMTPTDKKGIVFDRGDAFRFAWNALFADAKNGRLVKDNLIEKQVIGAIALNDAVEEAKTAVEVRKSTKRAAENGYYVLTVEEYKDKTKGAFLAEIAAFLSGYEFARNTDGTMRVAMPDDWFVLCNGPYAERTSRNPHEDKLRINEATGMWEVWNDDDFSIDILNQYILADMYSEYGQFATKKITDGWVKYDVWDMGGGHRRQGAYGLMSKHGYLPLQAGNREFGNLYNVNGEPYIANETLALSAAGMPGLAVEQATVFGSATSDRDPIRWMQYFTALISMAYIEDDIPAMMREAQKILPDGCWQDEVIDMIFDLHAQYPDDWRRAVINAEQMVWQKHYDSSSSMGESSINCSFILIGLLYGEGDFYETCKIIGLAGHGGDSTTATGVAVVAAVCGWSGFDAESKRIINEKIWQDGKGVIVNRNPPDTKDDYWMFCAGMDERLALADILDLYQENFERNLLANGGKIENGKYYIPVNTLSLTETVFTDEFEHGTLDGYKVSGTVENAVGSFSGDRGAKLSGGAKESALTKTLTGLVAGQDYRVSAFITTASATTATMFVENGNAKEYVTVHDQEVYVKREITFTAAADTAVVGFSVPAGTASHRYAIVDEVYVVRVEEKGAGSVAVSNATKDGTYTGEIRFTVNATTDAEVQMKLTFANAGTGLVNATITVDGEKYAGAPFHRTGENGRGVIYLPMIAKDKTTYEVVINVGDATVSLFDAELVTVNERF